MLTVFIDSKVNILQTFKALAVGGQTVEGWKVMTVYNMESANGNAVPNQFIIEDGHRTVFQSYSSTIAVIDRDKKVIEIHPDWDYSRTTGKYRNMFFDTYGFYRLSSKAGLVEAMDAGKACGFRIVTK